MDAAHAAAGSLTTPGTVADANFLLCLAVKSPAFRPPVANVLGKGLVWAEGDDHKTQRRILAPAFS